VDGSTAETCGQCGFDSRRWRLRDAATLFEELGWWWENATAGFGPDALNHRPGPAVWSVLEYGLHSALAAAVIRTEVAAILTEDGCTLDVDFDIGDATEDNWAVLDAARTRPVQRAVLTAGGVRGDRQRDHKHHGRPFQAVCLWSADVIDELSAAGHPIAPGWAGENLTLRGLDWESLRPGALISVGEALVELSFPATPRHNEVQCFSDGDFSRIAHEVNSRHARWYGWVRAPGEAHAGERVVVQV
jgi:MOSC domain-containing protein YiiM